MNPLAHIPALVTRQPWQCLAVSLLVALSFGAFAPFVQMVNNVDTFTLEDHPDTLYYQQFKEIFGNDEFFVICFQEQDLFTPSNLRLLKDITSKLEALPEVRDVLSLANANETRGGDDFFEVRPLLETIPDTPAGLADLKTRALNNPLYAKQLVSPDGTTTAIVVFTRERPEDPDTRKRLLEATDRILEPYRVQGRAFHLAGWTVVNLSLSRYMKRDLLQFIPITYLMIALTVWAFFRNVRLTLLAVANISACLTASMGFFRVSGILLNNVTVIVPPLVMALSLSDTVHIFSHLDRATLDAAAGDRRLALKTVLDRVVNPCFLTTLTTFVGFLSLGVSRIPPIRDFAWTAAAGMVFEFFFAFVMLPPLILMSDPRKIYHDPSDQTLMTKTLDAVRRLVQNRPRWITGGCVLLVLISLVAATRVRVETNFIDYFKRSDPLRTSTDFVETHLAGVSSLDICFEADVPDGFKDPENLRVMNAVEEQIRLLPGVDTALSLTDFLKDMNRAFHADAPEQYRLPDHRRLISQVLLLYDPDDLKDFVNDAFDRTRIAVRISLHRSSEQAELIHRIQHILAQTVPPHLQARVTGRAVQDVITIAALVRGQVQSLALAGAVIWAIMFLSLRSLRLGLFSLPPNLFPIALNFGVMGALSIPLNTATGVISAVAIGMAVDNTIHFLSVYSEKRRAGWSSRDSVGQVMMEKGRAMVSSSLILVVGFGILVSSRFVPTIYFGFLSALVMLTALAGDLLFLPGIILLIDRTSNTPN